MPPSPKTLSEIEQLRQMLDSQLRVNAQLSRTIWVLVNTAPDHHITIDEDSLDPLWELGYERPDAEKLPTVVKIIAKKMPEATEKQIAELAERLKGQSCHPGDAMTAVGLGDHPFHYISKCLSPLLVMHEGTWIPRSDYDKLKPVPEITIEAPPGTIPFPAQ